MILAWLCLGYIKQNRDDGSCAEKQSALESLEISGTCML